MTSADRPGRWATGEEGFVVRLKLKVCLLINGSPGLIMRSHGRIHYAFSFEIADGRVRNIYIISNPDKLRHLAG